MIAWVHVAPERRAGVHVDESWWVLWPRPAEAWARQRRPPRVPKAKSWRRGERPPSCCLYAEMDAVDRQARGEWHPTWNQEETWAFLAGLIGRYAARGLRYLVIFWDNAPWHVAARLRERLAAYNRQAKQEGGLRVLLFCLPKQAPWLMPLEPVFGQTKRAVGARQRETLAELQAAVERRLGRRNEWVAACRSAQHRSTTLASA